MYVLYKVHVFKAKAPLQLVQSPYISNGHFRLNSDGNIEVVVFIRASF